MSLQPQPGRLDEMLLSWVPVDAKRILEVGCGTGKLAAAYKLRNPRAEFIGLGAPRDGPGAGSGVDQLIEGDLESLTPDAIGGPETLDVVLMDGLLEQCPDPVAALEKAHRLLRPGGRLVVTARNLGHWSALSQLLAGEAPLPPSRGERAPPRGFTLTSLTDLLKRTGFTRVKARRTMMRDTGDGERWARALADAAEAMGLAREEFEARISASNYVLVCRKSEERIDPPAIFALLAASPQFLDVRTRLPAVQLDTLADLTVVYGERNISLPRSGPETPKILVQQRAAKQGEDEWLPQLADLIRKGWLVITEYDDHPDLFRELGRGKAENIAITLSASHAIQTSTPVLGASFREINSETRHFDNALFSLPPYRNRRTEPPRVFYGALNREGFSGRIAAALEPCLRTRQDVEFVVVHDQAFFKALPTRSKRFLPALPYDEYLKTMRECHVALMPLEGTPGELYKSDIKFLEVSGAGLATVASPAVYGDTIVEGQTGLIARTVEDWSPVLASVLDDQGLRERLAQGAHAYVAAERMFAYQAGARRDWYFDLWRRRQALTEALIARHPKLRALLAA